ncbi:MAG: uroporphyrinogen decarboxylase family protein [Armatimonadota bacterium]
MPGHIPWSIAVPPEVYAEYCGVTMREYHSDPAAQMHVQLEGPRILHEMYGLPLRRAVAPDFTTYLTGSVFGLRFEVFEDQIPAPLGHPITSIEEATELRVPEPIAEAGYYPQALEFFRWMLEHAPEGVTVGFSGGTQAPLTTAVVLRGEGLFVDIVDAPELVHRFMATLTESAIRQRVLAAELTGGPLRLESIGFTDDYGGLLGPEHYVEFDVQYMLRIAEYFGATSMTSHTELLRTPHLEILQEHGWTFIDVGTDPYLTVTDCLEVLDIPFLVQMKSSQELLLATPEEIRATYRSMVEEGAQRMLVELCRGVPEENVRAFIEVAREYE